MCDPVSATIATVGMVASQAMAPKTPKQTTPAAVPAPAAVSAPAAQAAKMPDQAAVRSQASAGNKPLPSGYSGNNTMLTGPSGVAPTSLLLGKTSLLGQ